eukprot:3571196-Amphidinium_carterae.1
MVRFTEPVSIRAVCTDSPGNLVPPALAPGAPVGLGGTELAAAGAPGGGVGVGGVYLPNAAGVNNAFAAETVFEALALLAQSIPDGSAVSAAMQILATRMALSPWTGFGSSERDRPISHGVAATSLLQFGAVPVHGTSTLTSLLRISPCGAWTTGKRSVSKRSSSLGSLCRCH